jgi:putative PIN family toxin of toxin-antitoxin system
VKITLDSTILIRAFDNTGGLARQLLFTILDGEHVLVLSNEILAETSKVLRYPRMRGRHGMSDGKIYEYVMFLQSVATIVRPDPTLIVPIRDPNDIVIIQTAMIGGAEAICTTDEDFFTSPASAFLQSVNIPVFTDAELIRRLRS